MEISPEADEPVDAKLPDDNEKPQQQTSTSGVEVPPPQSHDSVPVLGTAEAAPQLDDSMEVKPPQEHEKPEGSSDADIIIDQKKSELPTEEGLQESHNADPQLSEPMDVRVSDQEHNPGSGSQSEAANKEIVSGGGGSLTLLSQQYRDESSEDLSDSDDSDSSSSTSSSSSSSTSGVMSSLMNDLDQDEDQEDRQAPGKKPQPVKTQDELLIEDLPAVENLSISLPEGTEMETIGVISSIIDQLVIVESKKDSRPLNDESVLFDKDRFAIGKVFEVFGPVCQPYYVLRFNSHQDIEQRSLGIGEPVFFAPKIKDFTDYVFVEELNRAKGSDASWKNDQEPPPEALDFSDDEQERLAKQKLKEQKRQQHQPQGREESDSADDEKPTCKPQKPPRRKQRKPQHDRPGYHNPHGTFHNNYHANPHFQPQNTPPFQSQGNTHFQPPGSPHYRPQGNPYFQPGYTFPPPGPFHPPFQGNGFPPYPGPPPPPHMAPWPPGPYPGMMFQLPPPPPPPSN
ncbi:hypothetical protein NFI96_013087 [Prochilodus magdalenae]|nr:hypothetical protein NFI96_013087 [Prochilodus magdalenae]